MSKTIKLSLASRLTDSVLAEEEATLQPSAPRIAKIKRRSSSAPTDNELEAMFENKEIPLLPEDAASWQDIITANSGKTIKLIEKWL